MFSGCGGFDWGVQQLGAKVIWANDNDSYASATYQSLFPDVEFVEDDIRNIKTFPEADILIGCYPCTGFSEAARRKAPGASERDLRANRNNFLYEEFLRAIPQVNPRYLFVENVPGMATANGGWFLNEQLNGFRELGYVVDQPKVLTASDFGAPQARKRIFIVGVRKDLHADFRYEYPEPTHGPNRAEKFVTLEDVISEMPEWPEGEFVDKKFHGHYLTRNRKRGWKELSYTIVAHGHHVPLHPMGEPMKYMGTDAWALQGDKNRRLSWRECAAIQKLPKYIDPPGNLMQKHRVIGNAVPPVFGRTLIEPIVMFETGASE